MGLTAAIRRLGIDVPIFGAFAEDSSLFNVVARAFSVELGVSSDRSCARSSTGEDYPTECEPQLSNEHLEDVVTFIRFLAAPPRRAMMDAKAGIEIFNKVGCVSCHVSEITTITSAPLPLRSRVVAAYTDISKHDIWSGRPVRTAALWGVNSLGPPYLHDGSAPSIVDAIIRHAGEAASASEKFRMLPLAS